MVDGAVAHVNDYVKISLHRDPSQHSEGTVYSIVSNKDPSKTSVVLKNGDSGIVIQVIDSEQAREERIMAEDQHSENKANFYERVMRDEVIPKTVQSFLNSEGGYLYIGVADIGSLKERLVGLNEDFAIIDPNNSMTNDRRCDKLKRDIMTSLTNHLKSDESIGSSVTIKPVNVRGVQIIEMSIQKSPKPWFYTYKEKMQFQIYEGKEHVTNMMIDEFYIRSGGGKVRLETHKDVYDYIKNQFT